MTDQPRLDESALAELKEVMEDDFDTLVQTFRADSRSRIETLRAALAAEDCDQLAKTAHSFKGSCINMGAPKLSGYCGQLERAGKTGDLSAAAGRLDSVEQEFLQVDRCLRKL